LKEKEMTEDVHNETVSEDHPKGSINLEVTKFTNENLMTSDGLDAVNTIPRESTYNVDQVGRQRIDFSHVGCSVM
jgi:hypothetical protein